MSESTTQTSSTPPASKLSNCSLVIAIVAICGLILAGFGYRQDWWGLLPGINMAIIFF